jgi:hypothetical protein
VREQQAMRGDRASTERCRRLRGRFAIQEGRVEHDWLLFGIF